jgi:hypothetical protein
VAETLVKMALVAEDNDLSEVTTAVDAINTAEDKDTSDWDIISVDSCGSFIPI